MTDNYTDQLHPNAIPVAPPLVIYSTDQRNNADFLAQNPNTTVIPAVSKVLPDDYLSYSSNNYDINAIPNSEEYPVATYVSDSSENLAVPENLLIDTSSYRLQSDANDGGIVYLASLTFDQISGAEDYEVRLSIVNDN